MPAYTPTAIKKLKVLDADTLNSGMRAQARHGLSLSSGAEAITCLGLHPMDMALRQSEDPLVRDNFLLETENDLFDAVCRMSFLRFHCLIVMVLGSGL